jgi:hypothetical protein
MVSLDNTLERIALSFSVIDIMVPVDRLVKAPDESSAKYLLTDRTEFDVIPICKNGEIVKYLERGQTNARFVTVPDTISDGTSILRVIDILQQRRFGFVLGGNGVVGYIHFSDLNNSVVKLPFYVMFEALEYALTQRIQSLITEEILGKVLDPDRCDRVKKQMRSRQKTKSDFGWTSLLYFGEIISFARHLGVIKPTDEEISILVNIRNRVGHATDPLINNYNGIVRLVNAKRICLGLLVAL